MRGLLQTESIACGACGSVLDLTDENLQIISTVQSKIRIQPLIPLGVRGKLLGDTLEVIGFLRRKVTVEGVDYAWSEYLLFNPYKGFRWLSEYNGHWTFIRTITERPRASGSRVDYLNRQFQHFQTAEASVSYVLGEFFWRVQVGEKARVDDYVSPPYILSRESTANEIVWSLGQYVEPRVVAGAFLRQASLPAPVGVYSCQPGPFGATAPKLYRLFGRFLIAALFVQLLVLFLSRNQLVYQGHFVYEGDATRRPRSDEASFVTDVFDVPGRTTNVVVRTDAAVSNSWIYLSFALISEETGNAYDFGREVSYYFGRDSDGAWSEGTRSDEATLPSVPAGRYYLRIEPEGPGGSVSYSVKVYRDVPRWSFFWFGLLALVLPPGFLVWRRWRFEVQRWSESDHPIVTLSRSTDDD
ncbi:MAG TPA: DUF4178 domain-containing protein [Candidatus Binatia bacterium]|nr:DUF4178 domain-containing protein [Candidatus Binatia bacterium]